MSELIQNRGCSLRWRLLAEVSTLVLIGYAASLPVAQAEENDQPTVWIELGGQLSRLVNNQEIYAPPFLSLTPSEFSPPQQAERPPRYGMDESASLIFQPKGAEWNFSASIRYGRSSSVKHVRQQSSPTYIGRYSKFNRTLSGFYNYTVHVTNYFQVPPIAARFADARTKQSESHTILDFQAGRDLGIGLFGHNASSTLNFGVRFAQFASKSSVTLGENPDWQFRTQITHRGFSTITYYGGNLRFSRTNQIVSQPYHSFAGTFQASRSFTGLGPSISWSSSDLFAGDPESAALAFDWGVNAAVLFGRQKTKTHHQTIERYSPGGPNGALRTTVYDFDHGTVSRSRSVVVPNIGAFAGLSVKYPNAKVSFGYKADFFFGAMDGGIDDRRTEDIGFHGPYASVSIGLP